MKIAVMIYDAFCFFECSAALENFAQQEIPIQVFGEEKKVYRSEEGILCMAEYTIEELNVHEFDAVILTGVASDEFHFSDNVLVLQKIREFHDAKKVIAAISAGPMILIKAGIMKDRPFLCGCPRWGLLEEGILLEDMNLMKDGEECMHDESLICIRSGHILTSVAWYYREWAEELGNMLGITFCYSTFGLPKRMK